MTTLADVAPSLLGVIDLREGRAVHAVAGRRQHYATIDRAYCIAGDPLQLARFYRACGVAGLYLADLDAILGGTSRSAEAIGNIMELGLPVWLDAGAAELYPGEPNPGLTRIVGTESLTDLCEVEPWLGARSNQPFAVSLDLSGGRVISPARTLRGLSPLGAAGRLEELGVRELIVLDITRVGTSAGPSTTSLCREIRGRYPAMRLISGGGIRHIGDIQHLIQAGCQRVLTATWLQETAGSIHGASRND